MAELFRNFELNREPRWPILLRLLGASLALHATALACAMYLPPVRDAFNIAALLSNTGYVDRPFLKTEIGEDVRMVALAGEKFRYPSGYFALESQFEVQSQSKTPDPFAPRIISQAKREKRESTPAPSPSPVASPSPSPKESPEANEGIAVAGNSNLAEPKNPAETEQELNRIAAENGVVRPNENEINTRPLKLWLARANELKVKGELDLTSQVEITIAARLTTDCRLGDARIIQKSGDARLLDVARDMVSAIGDSRMLSFLRDPNKVKDSKELRCDEMPVQLSVKLDQIEISARVESQADTPQRAAQMAKGYSDLLTVAQLVKSGRDEEVLYKNTKVSAEGSQIVVSFSMPRQTASEILKKQLPAG